LPGLTRRRGGFRVRVLARRDRRFDCSSVTRTLCGLAVCRHRLVDHAADGSEERDRGVGAERLANLLQILSQFVAGALDDAFEPRKGITLLPKGEYDGPSDGTERRPVRKTGLRHDGAAQLSAGVGSRAMTGNWPAAPG
jgi:hypothetical protein